jgi:Copper amine oxidase N-terminal domain
LNKTILFAAISVLSLAVVISPHGPAWAQTVTPAPVVSASPAASAAPALPATPPMDFGSPPPGEVPILFNHHHVYVRQETVRHRRLLGALVKDGTILAPLRSMFEQMGATVSYDATTKSVKFTKPGSEVQVTAGKNEVVINGESSPLDVAPIMQQDVLLVPVRVISEALGAFVRWLPKKHMIVVRYRVPTPVSMLLPPPSPRVRAHHFLIAAQLQPKPAN